MLLSKNNFYTDNITVIASENKSYKIDLGFTPKSLWIYSFKNNVQSSIVENGFILDVYFDGENSNIIFWIVEKS